MRTLLVLGGTLIAAGAIVLSPSHGANAATLSGAVQDLEFNPPTINIQSGDTVEWEFVGAVDHNVTAVDGSFSSATMTSGTFSRTFSAAGTFAYYCTIHGTAQGQGMAGTVVVAAGAMPTNTVPAAAASATRTATRTPEATNTPSTPTSTTTPPAPGATATPVEAVPISAPADESPSATGGAAPVTAPRAGAGPDGHGSWTYVIAIVLAVSGAASVGGAVAVARLRFRG